MCIENINMDRLPLELISLITTKYLSSFIDQLAFITSTPRVHSAFTQFASSVEKYKFASEFDLIDASQEDWTFANLSRLYLGLQNFLSNKYLEDTSTRFHYSLDRRKGYFEDSEFRSIAKIHQNEAWIRETIMDSTFAMTFDRNTFVLMHSLNGRQTCIMTSWTNKKST